MTHICVGNLTIIGPDNGLSPGRHQCWDIVIWTPGDKLQWNLNRNSYIFVQENAFQIVVWKMVAILSRPQCVNSSPPGQNGCIFADDIFRCIFMNEKFCILNKISLKVVPNGPIDNNPALVQVMAWRRIDDKPLSESMLTWFTDAYMWH